MKRNRCLFFLIILIMPAILITCGKKMPLGGRQPDIDDIAPDFTLKNQDQINVKLSEFRKKNNVIIVFYPLDFTPV